MTIEFISKKNTEESREDWENRVQLSKITGVACDYWNEFFGLRVSYHRNQVESVKDFIKKRNERSPFKIKKYTERYPTDYAITEKNKEAVEKLDKLVDIVNSWQNNPELLTDDAFKNVCINAHLLIYGKEDIF